MRNIAHRKDPRMYNGNKRNNMAEENVVLLLINIIDKRNTIVDDYQFEIYCKLSF